MTAPTSKLPIGLAPGLERLGIAPAELLARAGLPSRLFDSPGARLDIDDYFALWAALGALGEPLVGVRLATLVEVDHTEPLFLAMLSAVDVAGCFDIVARYKRMLCPEDLIVTRDDDTGDLILTYTWPETRTPMPQVLVDLEHAFLVEMCRRGTRVPELSPRAIHVTAPRLDDLESRAAFFRCPIHTGSPGNAIRFAREDATRRFVTANPELLAALRPYLQAQTPASPTSAISKVRAVIAERLNGQRPTVDTIARDLAMSGRALQRLLTEHGTSFRGLLDEVRNQRAREYLSATALTDAEIAFLLGFEDPSSFYRAFRAWNGCAPSELRARPHLAG